MKTTSDVVSSMSVLLVHALIELIEKRERPSGPYASYEDHVASAIACVMPKQLLTVDVLAPL